MKSYLDIEDLEVYRKLCRLHLEVCELTRAWPPEEKYELGSQVRRSSNSSPSQLAEKNDDRHLRNKIEGVNRARGEAAETIHHLFMARLKDYMNDEAYQALRARYKECIRMLNGLEKSLERYLPEKDRRWEIAEAPVPYGDEIATPTGYPVPPPDHRTPTTEHRPLMRNDLTMTDNKPTTAVKSAVKDFTSGLACSQAVLAAFADRYELNRDHALRLAAAFEGGTAMQADTCGALVGVYLVLGLEYGGIDPSDVNAKHTTAEKVREATRLFAERNQGHTDCRDLIDCNISTPNGLDTALKKRLFRRRCPRFVRDAVRIAEGLLGKDELDAVSYRQPDDEA